MFNLAGSAAAADVFLEEACVSHHQPVPCDRESVHQPPLVVPASLLDLPRPHDVLGLLDSCTSLPRDVRSAKTYIIFT